MSPEQAQGKPIDWRTDIFSFGSMLYEMIAGGRAFGGDSAISTLAAIIKDEPAPLDKRVPARLRQIIERCLQKEPEQRFQAMADVRGELEEVRIDPRKLSLRRSGYRRAARFAGIILAAVISAAAVVYLWRASRSPGAPEIRALAVLPLANLSGDKSQDPIADGMTAALIMELGKIGALRTISRQSVLQFKGSREPLQEISRKLQGVDVVLTGDAAIASGRVSINVQLVRVQPERVLWTKNYDREQAEAVTLLREVATAVVRDVRAEVTPEEKRRLAVARPLNPHAYTHYLQGRYFVEQLTAESMAKARHHFEEAIRIDPDYAQGYAGLADAHFWSAWRVAEPPVETRAKALAAANRALQLDEGLAEAHVTRGGIILLYDHCPAEVEREYQRAIALNPNFAAAHIQYAMLLSRTGRGSAASAEAERALKLDPLSLMTNLQAGWVYWWTGENERAIAQFKKTLELDPNYPQAHYNLGGCYAAAHRYPEAIQSYKKALELGMPQFIGQALLAHTLGKSGNRREAVALIARLDEQAKREPGQSKMALALAYLGIGDRERAIQLLQEALRSHEGSLENIFVEPLWKEDLRDDSRFQAIVQALQAKEK
jgi:TolB-like protein/Tfp pilus assembly protein PilF